jgi:triosephosphate isomerase (TIM)
MARTPIIAGNWKMNKGTAAEATTLTFELLEAIKGVSGVEVVVCPPYTVLDATGNTLEDQSLVSLGAQNVFWKDSGAYTGNISAPMLKALHVKYVVLGHSEARGRFGVPEPDFDDETLKHFGETDVTVNRKARATLAAGLIPIVCVGETLAEREAGMTDAVIAGQISGALADIGASEVARSVIAYEPVWAIGTGKTCDTAEANRVCGVIRSRVAALYDAGTADALRIVYGGSMKPDNAAGLLAEPDIDGGLVGGASLKAGDFAGIVLAAANSAVVR